VVCSIINRLRHPPCHSTPMPDRHSHYSPAPSARSSLTRSSRVVPPVSARAPSLKTESRVSTASSKTSSRAPSAALSTPSTAPSTAPSTTSRATFGPAVLLSTEIIPYKGGRVSSPPKKEPNTGQDGRGSQVSTARSSTARSSTSSKSKPYTTTASHNGSTDGRLVERIPYRKGDPGKPVFETSQDATWSQLRHLNKPVGPRSSITRYD
jgi:hypothetical protein